MKSIKIFGFAILYLILCLIVMPIIVLIIQKITGLETISNMLGVFVRIMLALQISRRINKVTQVFPNYLEKLNPTINRPNLMQSLAYFVYFSLIFLMSFTLGQLNLQANVLALIITTLIKLLITYIIANVVRYIVQRKPRNLNTEIAY